MATGETVEPAGEPAGIDAAWLIPDAEGPASANRRIGIGQGRIASIADMGDFGKGRLVIPALANAHDHARIVRSSQIGSFDRPLEAWLPYLALIPSVDPWLASAVAYGRSAQGGVGSVMTHYTRIQGLTDFPTEARAVAKAARDIGLEMALAVQCRDRNPLVYGPSAPILDRLSPAARDCVSRRFLKTPLPAAEQVALVEAVAREIEGDGISVQYGPAAVQWCSDELLTRIADASQRSGRRVHMHLLETHYQRDWADRAHPNGIVRHLDRIGLLSERLSLAHCVHATPDELDLIAERGATIVVSTSSTLLTRSGVAPVAEMIRRGCKVAMGLDGLALEEDEDGLREMRLAYTLHKGRGFETGMSRRDLWRFAFAHGRRAIIGEEADGEEDGGTIAVGARANLLVLDWQALAADLVEPDVPALDLLLARARREHVRDLYVRGRAVVRDGKVQGVDLPGLEAELLARLRAARASTGDLRTAMPELERAIATYFGGSDFCA